MIHFIPFMSVGFVMASWATNATYVIKIEYFYILQIHWKSVNCLFKCHIQNYNRVLLSIKTDVWLFVVLFIHIILKIQNVLFEPTYTYVWFLCQQSLISLKMYYAEYFRCMDIQTFSRNSFPSYFSFKYGVNSNIWFGFT